MTAHCIPFNMTKSDEWDNMLKALMNVHEFFKYARYEKARTTRVEVAKGRVAASLEELRRQWPVTNCLLQLDGLTDRIARSHINVMVSFPKGAIFLRSVCMSNRSKGAVVYYEILKLEIGEVEEDDVVGLVMGNASVCATAGRMIEAEFPHIFSISCTTHNIDLMLEAFPKIGWVDVMIRPAVELTKKPKMGEDEFLLEEDLDLEKEVQAHADMHVEEWRSCLWEENRTRECDDKSKDDSKEDDDDDVANAIDVEENNGDEGQMVRTRIKDSGGVIDNVEEEEYCDSQEQPVGAAPKPPNRKPRRPRKVAEEETAAMEESSGTGENGAEGREEEAFDSEEEPLARKKRKQSESTH
ncbi:hypothetical protein CBR_g34369 [Chara braunii]|uniref:DUF659 domain-containing protein n=1 Tax=Chara braunii TaxID=69332 RepID=A0A388LIE4_CHABU|nr:hypothetical protein CBR_g34369 [Chara braunii]|eukprot:GBG82089.1 hypothetical protein CBR_g34369 [Chara braunii]